MPKDDMFAISYKILRYMEACMKAGKAPDLMDFSCDSPLLQISQHYWSTVMDELIENGYLKGFREVATKDGRFFLPTGTAGITLKGAEFLKENAIMQKAQKAFGKAVELILAALI